MNATRPVIRLPNEVPSSAPAPPVTGHRSSLPLGSKGMLYLIDGVWASRLWQTLAIFSNFTGDHKPPGERHIGTRKGTVFELRVGRTLNVAGISAQQRSICIFQ